MLTTNKYIQLKETFATISKAIGYIPRLPKENYSQTIAILLNNLNDAVMEINLELLDSSSVNLYNTHFLDDKITDYAYKDTLTVQYMLWHKTMLEVLERQYNAQNSLDEKFIKLMDYIELTNFEDIVEKAKSSLFAQENSLQNQICSYYQILREMWGTLDISNNQYDVIINRVTELKEHTEDFIWLYNRLEDWRSKLVLVNMLYNWITLDLNFLREMKEANFTDYFDLDLVKCGDNEVVVDLGTWIGDSTLNYIKTYGKYKKIYCYEIDEMNMNQAKKNLAGYPNIEFRRKGAGSKNGTMYIQRYKDQSCNKVVATNTGKEIEIVSIDTDIREKITLIKMDIEGGEQDALLGCKRHIEAEAPKLLISVYHNNEDIWKIPRMVDEIRPDYHFYLRSNGAQYGPAEIVMFAL